jgi:hypothetical protein
MRKTTAIKSLGGTVKKAAAAVGVSYQAVYKWPATLPPRVADRIVAALSRLETAGKAPGK